MPNPASYIVGIGHLKNKNYFDSVLEFTKAILEAPSFSNAYFYRAVANYNLKKYDKAIADYTLIIEKDPVFSKQACAYYNRGMACVQIKKNTEAINDFTKVIEIMPRFAPAYENRAMRFHKESRFLEALADYDKAIELDPSLRYAYLNRGNIFFSLKKYEESISSYTKSIGLAMVDTQAYLYRGMAFYKLNRYLDSLRDFKFILEKNPQDQNALKAKAKAEFKLKEAEVIGAAPKSNDPTQNFSEIVSSSSGHNQVANIDLPSFNSISLREESNSSDKFLVGPGSFAINVVGESHYQSELLKICGPKQKVSAQIDTVALLVLENSNIYDKNAVAVFISNLKVGYLSRSHAIEYRKHLDVTGLKESHMKCNARINGGWDDGKGNTGFFGVKLDLPKFQTAANILKVIEVAENGSQSNNSKEFNKVEDIKTATPLTSVVLPSVTAVACEELNALKNTLSQNIEELEKTKADEKASSKNEKTNEKGNVGSNSGFSSLKGRENHLGQDAVDDFYLDDFDDDFDDDDIMDDDIMDDDIVDDDFEYDDFEYDDFEYDDFDDY